MLQPELAAGRRERELQSAPLTTLSVVPIRCNPVQAGKQSSTGHHIYKGLQPVAHRSTQLLVTAMHKMAPMPPVQFTCAHVQTYMQAAVFCT